MCLFSHQKMEQHAWCSERCAILSSFFALTEGSLMNLSPEDGATRLVFRALCHLVILFCSQWRVADESWVISMYWNLVAPSTQLDSSSAEFGDLNLVLPTVVCLIQWRWKTWQPAGMHCWWKKRWNWQQRTTAACCWQLVWTVMGATVLKKHCSRLGYCTSKCQSEDLTRPIRCSTHFSGIGAPEVAAQALDACKTRCSRWSNRSGLYSGAWVDVFSNSFPVNLL